MHDIGSEGRILPLQDRTLLIEFRSDRIPERKRFTIFHEFAHTLFPDFYEFLPHHYGQSKAPKDPERGFENLCDIAASEMLLPLENVQEDLVQCKTLCFEEFAKLSRRYVASIDATAMRLTELVDGLPCSTVFLTDQKGNNSGRGPLWVKYFCRNSLFKAFIPIGASPPPGSVAYDCYGGTQNISALVRETWCLNGSARSWSVQAIKLPEFPESPDYAKVAVLLLPS
jgi:hypothetical protein